MEWCCTWYGVVHGMVWYMVWCGTWYGVVHGMVRYMLWCGTWHGAVHGMVQCGSVLYATLCYGMRHVSGHLPGAPRCTFVTTATALTVAARE